MRSSQRKWHIYYIYNSVINKSLLCPLCGNIILLLSGDFMRIRKIIFLLVILSSICSIMVVSGCTGISTGNNASPTNGPVNNPSLSPAATQAATISPAPVPTEASSRSSFNDGDNGNEVSLHKGDVFTISLVQAMGYDYSWGASTSSGLKMIDSKFQNANTAGIAGLGDPSQVWALEVTSDGPQWFKAENNGGAITIATYMLYIDVN
jgi:predicted secreted protein